MKKVLIVAAAAGLMSLAACNTTPTTSNELNAETAADNFAMQADNLEAAADNATTEAGAAILENAAGNADAAAANAQDQADAIHANAN
jgi:hypothetical protein